MKLFRLYLYTIKKLLGDLKMAKSMDNKKETKKKPAKTASEKRTEKRLKKKEV